MKTRIFIILSALALCHSVSYAQTDNFDGRPEQPAKKVTAIEKKIKVWHLIDGYSYADSLQIDTLLNGFQVSNPVMAQNPMVIHTGNMGAPSQSMVLGHMGYDQDFIFLNALKYYFAEPDLYQFYNTTVPYTNLTYRTGGPKRRSEENISVLFTQNVNKKLNLGVSYNLMSSIGRYNAQRADNERVRLFASYNGNRYSAHGNISLNQTDQYENGGLDSEDPILNPNKYGYDQTENIPVEFTTAKNKIKNSRFFYTHSLGIGNISLKDSTQTDLKMPMATAYHTVDYDTYKRTYTIDNLAGYYSEGIANAFYQNLYTDTVKTRDTSRYAVLRNTVQLKFNEEANTLLRFGLRAYVINEVKFYQAQTAPSHYQRIDGISYPTYVHENFTRPTTAIGGQIFKNRGQNFWWNAGLKVYVQGYRAGDSEITGHINSLFKVWRDTAGIFASGGLYLQSPGMFFEQYYSNHFKWDESFNREKTFRARGGIRIPTKRFELTGEIRLINDHMYWNFNALPDQSSGVLQVVEMNLNQHFKIGGFNSANRLWWQATSNAEAMPLPTFAAYTSNYYENVAFKVLRFQIGFDAKVNTKYYAPSWMPATMQFYNQRSRQFGEYPMVDAFINFHLKRARISLKMEHVNQGYPNNNSILIAGYPANPRSFKVGVSWNFYD